MPAWCALAAEAAGSPPCCPAGKFALQEEHSGMFLEAGGQGAEGHTRLVSSGTLGNSISALMVSRGPCG